MFAVTEEPRSLKKDQICGKFKKTQLSEKATDLGFRQSQQPANLRQLGSMAVKRSNFRQDLRDNKSSVGAPRGTAQNNPFTPVVCEHVWSSDTVTPGDFKTAEEF
jgi:hypothetical protein